MYLKDFSEISKDDVKEVGGKGASLGEMTNAGIPVPPGFVVTTRAYKEFEGQEIPAEVKEQILVAFDELNAVRVAVRSSAVAEDSSAASWAGQLDTFLNVTKEDLIESIRKCWNSMMSENALAYADQHEVSKDQLQVAVVVQKMVESETAGVMFTVNPVTSNKEEIMIEAGFGLGEMLVQGMITPDNFIVDKNSLEITAKSIDKQEMMMVYQDGENKEIEVPVEIQSMQALPDSKVKELAELGIRIENHYGFPCDIEWALEKNTLYIVQSRPITTLG
jgi:phosphoenolpyruvate synthase/pyruvate phosphate dikinase